MSFFAVIRAAGPAWEDGKGAFEQPDVNDHATFMDTLAERGSVLFAGPLAGTEHERIRVLLIMDVADEAEAHRLLAGDPWALADRILVVSVEAWNVFVGAQRLAAA